jgi:hypothetical protein
MKTVTVRCTACGERSQVSIEKVDAPESEAVA